MKNDSSYTHHSPNLKTGNKGKILTALREKKTHHFQENNTKNDGRLSSGANWGQKTMSSNS